jgi:hypothetical protein
MPPRNPQPNHPSAQAAADEAQQIDSMANVTAPAAPALDAPVDLPVPASAPLDDPVPAGANDDRSNPPQDEEVVPAAEFRRLQDQLNSERGRVAERERRLKDAEDAARTAQANREFTERRLQELTAERTAAVERAEALEAERDVSDATREFKSEHVDSEAFGDIYRGIHGRLRKQLMGEFGQVLKDHDQKTRTEFEERERKIKIELNERLISRDVPGFEQMLDRQDFKDFLSERVPGTRTDRRAELIAAWKDGDTRFIGDMVADFNRRGAPRAVDQEPLNVGRHVADQVPRAPQRTQRITEGQLEAMQQAVRDGSRTREEYRKLRSVYDKQEQEDWSKSRRQN